MSRTWSIPNISEQEHGKPPSIWWCVAAFVVILSAGIIIAILSLEPGKPVLSDTFFMRALLFPLLAWGGVCGVIYKGYEDRIERVAWWNFMCRSTHEEWRRWAQSHVAILGSVVLTPEPELAERLLGLEGSAPMNPDKVLVLPEVDIPLGSSRAAVIFEQLLTPLAERISRFTRNRSFNVVLQSDNEQDLNELWNIWKKLNLPDQADLRWLAFEADQTEREPWFEQRWQADFQLVLACQLHSRGEGEASCSEVAAAMLFTSPQEVENSKGKLRPQARLFRPISKPSDSVEDALEVLLAAEQTPSTRIRHAWLSDLPPQGRHATISAVKEVGLDLAAHDVDQALGKPGPVNALLLQALAAQMVEHGQGAQLVASPHAQNVMLNVVGTQLTPLPQVEDGYFRMLRLSVTIGVNCCLVLIMFMLEIIGASTGWFRACFAGMLLLIPLQMGGSILKRRMLEDDFCRQMQRSEAKI